MLGENFVSQNHDELQHPMQYYIIFFSEDGLWEGCKNIKKSIKSRRSSKLEGILLHSYFHQNLVMDSPLPQPSHFLPSLILIGLNPQTSNNNALMQQQLHAWPCFIECKGSFMKYKVQHC